MSKSIVDTGTPPPEVEKMRRKKKAILSSKDDDIESKQADYVPEVGFAAKPKIRTYEAIISHDLYTITLEILDISISDFQVALKVPRNGCKFEPIPQSSFRLRTKGKNYLVTYLGGIFDFPSDDHWTITFLMDPDLPENNLDEKILQALEDAP